jgi:predicted ATPase
LVVATYRSDGVHGSHPFGQFLAEAMRLRNVTRLELRPFRRDEVLAQVTALQRAVPAPEAIDRIFDRSDGNAFFVEELVHASRVDPTAPLTASLRELLLARVHALPDTAQRVVQAVAGSGGDVSHALLLAVADLPEERLIEALHVAIDAYVLRPTADYDGYGFRHALVREAVGARLLPSERVRWSRRYAEALAGDPSLVPGEKYAPLIAGYWYGAGQGSEALVACLRAAADARRRYAYADELKFLSRVIELWRTLPLASLSSLSLPSENWPSRSDIGPPTYADILAQAAAAA